MTYDLHFECGRKEKHNNWIMHTFAMVLFYELGIWNKDQLEIELTKSSMAMNEAMGRDQDSKKKTDKTPIRAIVTVEKIPADQVDAIEGHFFKDEDGTSNSSEAWVAKVEFMSKPSNERIKSFMRSSERTILHAIRQAKRTDYFIEECGRSQYKTLFTKLLKNDGEEITALEAGFLLSKFLSIKTAILQMASEYMPVDIPSLVGHFAYSAGSGYSFRVY